MDPERLQEHRIQDLPRSFYYIPNFITESEETELLTKARSPTSPFINTAQNRWTQLSHRRLQVYPAPLTKSNVLLAQPLPAWLSDPILPRFEELGIFTTGEAQDGATSASNSSDGDRALGERVMEGKAEGTPHLAPNHVLINEYPPGQGIMPHEDGDAYAPVVATVTLGSHCVLELFSKPGHSNSKPGQTNTEGGKSHKPQYRILQEPRSLLVTRGRAYKEFLHGIADVEWDEDLRAGSVVNWDLLGDVGAFKGGSKRRELRISLTYRDVIKVSQVGSKLFGGLRR